MNPDRLRHASVGDVLAGPPHALTMARALAFSGGALDAPHWPERNLHTDIDEARAAGLAAVVASGTQFEGYLASHLVALCESSWFDHGEWDVKIVRSVKVSETITAMAKLIGRESTASGMRVEFDVWCENQEALKVLVGTARCTLIEDHRA